MTRRFCEWVQYKNPLGVSWYNLLVSFGTHTFEAMFALQLFISGLIWGASQELCNKSSAVKAKVDRKDNYHKTAIYTVYTS